MHVRFYGMLRDYVGVEEVEVELGGGMVSEEEFLDTLAKRLKGFREVLDQVRSGELSLVLLVNGRPLRRGEGISPGDRVDVLPPAAGG